MKKIFNAEKQVLLRNESSEVLIDMDFGVLAHSWKVDGREILYSPESYLTCLGKRMCGIPLMYPFANRIFPELLSAENRVSEPLGKASGLLRDGNGNIMHGLLLWKSGWTLIHQNQYEVVFQLEWDEHFWAYSFLPLRHTLQLFYLITKNGLQVGMRIENQDQQPLPLSYGFHPYFKIDRERDMESTIEIPANRYYVTNDQLFPTGSLEKLDQLKIENQCANLGKVALDTCFTNLDVNEKNQIVTILKTPDYHLKLSMDAIFDNLIVYVPQDKHKPYICIEPMIASTNAWHTGAGLKYLAAGATHVASFQIEIELKD